MRTNNSIKNIFISILAQLVIVLLGFISRKVFLDSLGAEYLGINGLLTNVLSMLALVESGIGTAIVFSLYKPLAIKDNYTVIALVQLYKKVYKIIALIILIFSIFLYPFLGYFMKGEVSISYITVAYFIFVAKNIITYLNAHKISLIISDQKGYVLTSLNLVFQITITIAKILVLIITGNYIIYLLIELFIFMLQNIISSLIVSKRYPFINTKEKFLIKNEEKASIITKVKALFIHNIGGFALNGSDNILISAFLGLTTVGLYSNYSMITGQLTAFLAPLFNGIGASVGNLIAIESNTNRYKVFNVVYFLNFWVYSVSVIFLYNLLDPFISWWLGKEYLIEKSAVVILLINIYISGLRSSVFTFKVKGGIFVEDKYMPLIGAGINLVTSILLVKILGITGIFLGTTISILFVFWKAPNLVFQQIFNRPVNIYYKKYVFYAVLTIIAGSVTTFFCTWIPFQNNFVSLASKGIVCLLIINIIYFIIFHKTDEFMYLMNVLKVKLKIKNKVKLNKTKVMG
ncbi:oligosaccharide flippase family protein [Mesobacillus subterraneus]|uniref:lipopolysaccharide biosynthesis protein n=1 Tax=Mesobacillus subterraneus TaxID=285983 RepID=UPI002040EFBE|nr:oligosaccharide flippase family protein [Mesobacillus subterraneus]MCM3665244.1 oligosaccharide flippase family protein [Mesobacillus subterraneus]MCM3684257.1 oligosaccharide flippase family protein [Mesobacillus subterraneus]